MNKLIVVAVICVLIGFGTGYIMGGISSMNWCVKTGMYFLDLKGIEIDIDEEMLGTLTYQYKENIGGCLFTQNASLYGD